MDPLHKLQQLIAQADFVQSSTEDHREIYNLIEQVVLSPKSPITKHVPPLNTIIYSIRGILSPTFATNRISDLLDLLATAEFYRCHTLDRARDARTWNDYYRKESRTVTLTAEEEKKLRNLEGKRDTLRSIYVEILCLCCELDLFFLWTADPASCTNFLTRFNEYFPSLNRYANQESPRLFYTDLSAAEKVRLLGVGKKCCQFTVDSVNWASEYPSDGSVSIQKLFQTKDFRAAFPLPVPITRLCDNIHFYINYVDDAAKSVQEMFPGGNC